MNKRRFAALLLALSVLPGTAASASTLGEEIRRSGVELTDSVLLAKGVHWSSAYSDRLAENYLEYTPTRDVRPVVAYGDKVIGTGSFSRVASGLESAGQHVIGGINADYYVMASSQPLGIVITDGVLRSSDGGHAAVAFREDGTAFIGYPSIKMTASLNGQEFPVETFNKRRNEGGYALFNSDFAATTLNYTAGTDLILVPKEGSSGVAKVDWTANFAIEEIRKSTGSIDIPSGKYILSLSGAADEWRHEGLSDIEPGDEVTIDISCQDWRLPEAESAVGSFRVLVSEGAVVPGLDVERGPRTAVGIKADGSIILYTIDGRQPGVSIGAGMRQVAERLVELGCVEAGLMDGGGSTGLSALYIGEESLSQINSPSDGAPRSVANYIMLVTTAPATGIADRLGVTPYDAVMLSGAEKKFTVKASDETLRPAAMPGEVSFEVADGLGDISSDGLFKAGAVSTEGILTAKSGNVEGHATIKVVDTPDIITVYNEADWKALTKLDIKRGAAVNMYAASSYNHMSLIVQDTCYDWEVIGDIGAIDEWGRFTAADHDAKGEIRVTAGGHSVTLTVTVGWDNPYKDVAVSDWFFEAVKYAADNGIMNGTASNAFSPNGAMTRAMFVTVLGRMAGITAEDYDERPFADVPPDMYYTEYVAWAAESGIVAGMSPGFFGPDLNITREQLCTILARYLDETGEELPPAAQDAEFEDAVKISGWALEAVARCHAAGLVTGRGGGVFDPQASASRAEVAAILMRLVDR